MAEIKLVQQLSRALSDGDIEAYRRLRYPAIQDGEELIFTDQDFKKVDFSLVNCGFFVFDNCDLTGASGFSGQPITMKSCQARNLDLRNSATVIKANNCDFRGLKINNNTNLANSDQSQFTNCLFDPEIEQKLRDSNQAKFNY